MMINIDNDDPIATTLGIDPLRYAMQTQEVLPPEVKPPRLELTLEQQEENNIRDDIEIARQNVLALLEVTKNAINEAADIASQSQHPKAYDALSTLVKTALEANRQAIELHKDRKELTGEVKPTTINQNLYITTAELQQLIKNSNKSNE